ncbi:MAG: hypothetical protein KF869_01185 [Phycisphaeraceae bacterium]|nr:hypothetical protein [Phycisphaeraceae bacterium]
MTSAIDTAPGGASRARFGAPVALAGLSLALLCALAAIGESPGIIAAAGMFTAVANTLQGGIFALAYILAAVGLGRPLAAACAPGLPSRLWVQAALGIGLLLWLSHLLGVLGLLSGQGAAPRIVAWAAISIGLVALSHQMVRGDLAPERWPAMPRAGVLLALPLATLLAAAASPPGALWDSEFGGYDVLSYHLQLPKEWAAGTALAPAAHNVYSYLPGYVEAAYLHLGLLMPGRGDIAERFLGADGLWIHSCQMLHALLGVLGSLLCGRCAWAAAAGAGAPPGLARAAGIGGALVALGTGWTAACGSLAYNEMGVLLCGAAALLLCIERAANEHPASARQFGAGIGLLIGTAASCKPTALILLGPCAGLLMLAALPRRTWPAAVLAGAAAGLLVLAPWLVRNALAGGNPVFPFAAGTLGAAHWTAEQADRYARAHSFDGTILDRFALLFSPRGFLHPHWGATPFLAAGAAFAALARGSRVMPLLLAAGIAAGIIAWMFATHVQSRFLYPLLPPMVALLGYGVAAAKQPSTLHAPRAEGGPLPLLVLVLACAPAVIGAANFTAQREGRPNALLLGGVGALTGLARVQALLDLPADAERASVLRQTAGPDEVINTLIAPGLLGPATRDAAGLAPPAPTGAAAPRVLLIGDATPLYCLAADGTPGAGVVYHTTWDRSPLGDAFRAGGNEPAAWTAALRARGFDFVLINVAELSRLIDRDRNHDPDVTMPRIAHWLIDPGANCEIVWSWGSAGGIRHLVRLDPPRAPASGGAP